MKEAGLLTIAPRTIKATGQLIVSSLHTYNVGLPAVQDCMEMSLPYIAPCKDIPAQRDSVQCGTRKALVDFAVTAPRPSQSACLTAFDNDNEVQEALPEGLGKRRAHNSSPAVAPASPAPAKTRSLAVGLCHTGSA